MINLNYKMGRVLGSRSLKLDIYYMCEFFSYLELPRIHQWPIKYNFTYGDNYVTNDVFL